MEEVVVGEHPLCNGIAPVVPRFLGPAADSGLVLLDRHSVAASLELVDDPSGRVPPAGYAAAGIGMTPSCCIMPNRSQLNQSSAQMPSTNREITIASTSKLRPVAGIPRNAPRC